MDGTAGVTQDAVPPGGEFVYRFRATHPGTFWYHSHQVTHEQVERGLFGALVVTPRTPARRRGRARARAPLRGPPHRQRPGGRRARHGGAGHPRAGAGRQHRRGPDAGVADRRRVPGRRRRRPRGARAHPAARHVGGGHRGRAGRPGGDRPASSGRRRAGRDRRQRGDRARHAAAADPGARDHRRHADLRHTRPARLRPGRGHPPVRLRDRAHASASSTALPGLWWTVNGHLYPDVPMYVVREGDVVTMHITQHQRRGAPHAPARPPRGRARPATACPRPAARGGSTRSTSRTASPTTSRSSPTTRASGWITATSSGTPRDGLVAHLMYEGIDTPVPRRRTGRKLARVDPGVDREQRVV